MSGIGSYGLLRGAQQSLKRKKKVKSKDGAPARRGSDIALDALPPAKKTDAAWEFSRDKLSGLTEIGHGQFGVVYIGYADGIIPGKHKVRVAVKTLAADDDKDDFLAEASIMKALDGDHKIVRLLGLCTDKAPYYMIMELMARGDLKSVLRATRPKRDGPSGITKQRMVLLGADVAEGMEYLSSVSIVHRDLAARNCLVSEDYEAKVGDFGLTRKTYCRDYYRMKGSAPLPIRWMAPESLEDGVFSSASDVWSFGVLLWEIGAFGTLPYPELDNMDILDKLIGEDYRLGAPGGCPAGLHSIMLKCWQEDAEDRITFGAAKKELERLAERVPKDPVTLAEARGAGPAAFDEADDDEEGEDGGADEGGAAYAEIAEDVNGYAAPADIMRLKKTSAYENPFVNTRRAAFEDPAQSYAVPRVAEKKSGVSEVSIVATWIKSVTGRTVEASDLHAALRTGEVLCVLINKLQPGTVKKPYTGRSAFKVRKNIADFIEGAQLYGVHPRDLFDVDDLYCDDDMPRVVLCIMALKRLADERAK